MIITVNYHGDFADKTGIGSENISFGYPTNILNLLVHLLKKYDKKEDLFFGSRNVVLNKNMQIKVNGAFVFSIGIDLKDGDIVDILPPSEEEIFGA